jgi:hypothetical protein
VLGKVFALNQHCKWEKEQTEVDDICFNIKPIAYSPGNLFMPNQSGGKGK